MGNNDMLVQLLQQQQQQQQQIAAASFGMGGFATNDGLGEPSGLPMTH